MTPRWYSRAIKKAEKKYGDRDFTVERIILELAGIGGDNHLDMQLIEGIGDWVEREVQDIYQYQGYTIPQVKREGREDHVIERIGLATIVEDLMEHYELTGDDMDNSDEVNYALLILLKNALRSSDKREVIEHYVKKSYPYSDYIS